MFNTYYLHSIYTCNTKQQLVHITSNNKSMDPVACNVPHTRSTHTGSSAIHLIYITFT